MSFFGIEFLLYSKLIVTFNDAMRIFNSNGRFRHHNIQTTMHGTSIALVCPRCPKINKGRLETVRWAQAIAF